MTKNRIIFFSIFAAYHLIGFIFTLMIDKDTSLLFSIVSYISWFKYGTFFGLILLVVDFVWSWKINKESKAKEEAARHENNVLKAKVYDFQEAGKPASTPQAPK
jgi:hypothetical protein